MDAALEFTERREAAFRAAHGCASWWLVGWDKLANRAAADGDLRTLAMVIFRVRWAIARVEKEGAGGKRHNVQDHPLAPARPAFNTERSNKKNAENTKDK